ncbi:hypothetical protein [Amaricoccus macauensis]|uniref:hypothetical protein n=1 Tax=Amaricoccus macauensis TaxID=57001 RepID=UPI003C7DD1EF
MCRLVSQILALLFCLSAGEARAGAWPREEGQVFIAVSQTMSTGARTVLEAVQDVRSYSSLYAEYGLTPEITAGLDAGFARGDQDEASAWNLFLRRPVRAWENGHRVAASLGIGQLTEPEYGRQWRIKPGMSWGKGFESRWGNGWAGVEASAAYRFASKDFGYKADFTVGLKPSENWMGIMQVQTGRYGDDDPIIRLAPSVVRKFGERIHIQLGFIGSVAGDDSMGVKFGTWFTF